MLVAGVVVVSVVDQLMVLLTRTGPYTLATAVKLPGCIAAVVIAGVAPFDGEGLDFLAGQGQDSTLQTLPHREHY